MDAWIKLEDNDVELPLFAAFSFRKPTLFEYFSISAVKMQSAVSSLATYLRSAASTGAPEPYPIRITQDIHTALKERLFAASPFPAAFKKVETEDLVDSLGGNLERWCALEDSSFATITMVLLFSEKCMAREEGIYQLLKAQETIKRTIDYKKRIEYKRVGGKKIIKPLLTFFLDKRHSVLIRRWVGLLLAELLEAGENISLALAMFEEPESRTYPLQLGKLVVEGRNQIIRQVAGKLIATMAGASNNASVLDLILPRDGFDMSPFEHHDFPITTGMNWEFEFAEYSRQLDEQREEKDLRIPMSFCAIAISIGDSCLGKLGNITCDFHDTLAIRIPEGIEPPQEQQWIDIDVTSIDNITMSHPQMMGSQGVSNLSIKLRDLKELGYTCLLNMKGMDEVSTIVLTVRADEASFIRDDLLEARTYRRDKWNQHIGHCNRAASWIDDGVGICSSIRARHVTFQDEVEIMHRRSDVADGVRDSPDSYPSLEEIPHSSGYYDDPDSIMAQIEWEDKMNRSPPRSGQSPFDPITIREQLHETEFPPTVLQPGSVVDSRTDVSVIDSIATNHDLVPTSNAHHESQDKSPAGAEPDLAIIHSQVVPKSINTTTKPALRSAVRKSKAKASKGKRPSTIQKPTGDGKDVYDFMSDEDPVPVSKGSKKRKQPKRGTPAKRPVKKPKPAPKKTSRQFKSPTYISISEDENDDNLPVPQISPIQKSVVQSTSAEEVQELTSRTQIPVTKTASSGPSVERPSSELPSSPIKPRRKPKVPKKPARTSRGKGVAKSKASKMPQHATEPSATPAPSSSPRRRSPKFDIPEEFLRRSSRIKEIKAATPERDDSNTSLPSPTAEQLSKNPRKRKTAAPPSLEARSRPEINSSPTPEPPQLATEPPVIPVVSSSPRRSPPRFDIPDEFLRRSPRIQEIRGGAPGRGDANMSTGSPSKKPRKQNTVAPRGLKAKSSPEINSSPTPKQPKWQPKSSVQFETMKTASREQSASKSPSKNDVQSVQEEGSETEKQAAEDLPPVPKGLSPERPTAIDIEPVSSANQVTRPSLGVEEEQLVREDMPIDLDSQGQGEALPSQESTLSKKSLESDLLLEQEPSREGGKHVDGSALEIDYALSKPGELEGTMITEVRHTIEEATLIIDQHHSGEVLDKILPAWQSRIPDQEIPDSQPEASAFSSRAPTNVSRNSPSLTEDVALPRVPDMPIVPPVKNASERKLVSTGVPPGTDLPGETAEDLSKLPDEVSPTLFSYRETSDEVYLVGSRDILELGQNSRERRNSFDNKRISAPEDIKETEETKEGASQSSTTDHGIFTKAPKEVAPIAEQKGHFGHQNTGGDSLLYSLDQELSPNDEFQPKSTPIQPPKASREAHIRFPTFLNPSIEPDVSGARNILHRDIDNSTSLKRTRRQLEETKAASEYWEAIKKMRPYLTKPPRSAKPFNDVPADVARIPSPAKIIVIHGSDSESSFEPLSQNSGDFRRRLSHAATVDRQQSPVYAPNQFYGNTERRFIASVQANRFAPGKPTAGSSGSASRPFREQLQRNEGYVQRQLSHTATTDKRPQPMDPSSGSRKDTRKNVNHQDTGPGKNMSSEILNVLRSSPPHRFMGKSKAPGAVIHDDVPAHVPTLNVAKAGAGRFFDQLVKQGILSSDDGVGQDSEKTPNQRRAISPQAIREDKWPNDENPDSSSSSSDSGSSETSGDMSDSTYAQNSSSEWQDTLPDYHKETLEVLEKISKHWIFYLMSNEEKVDITLKEYSNNADAIIQQLTDMHHAEYEEAVEAMETKKAGVRVACREVREKVRKLVTKDEDEPNLQSIEAETKEKIKRVGKNIDDLVADLLRGT